MALGNRNTKKLIDVAAGRVMADLAIKNCKTINVFTNEIIVGDIAIVDGLIAGVGSYSGVEEIDADGYYACPGLVDGHVHIESSMSTPGQFAKAVMPRGTTTIIADPHEIANVRGLDGIRYILNASKDIPLDVHIMLPSCVPATNLENSGAILDAAELQKLMDDEGVIGLGELMDFMGTVSGEQSIIDKLDLFAGKVIDGHGPVITGNEINGYAAGGVKTEHECSTVEEMLERMRLGMYIQAREGSAAKNLEDLLKGVTAANSRRVMFCTDDRHPEDILGKGHIDNNVRIAIKSGIDPIEAIKMASLNPCECYRIYDKGAIAPGYKADVLLLKDIDEFHVDKVFKDGVLVAEKGKALFEVNETYDANVLNTVNYKEFAVGDLGISISNGKARAIKLIPHSLVTESVVVDVDVKNGKFASNSQKDLLKLAVVERHKRTGNIGLGIVEGFGLENGAIATSVGHDSHNIIVIGDSDDDMKDAVTRIGELGGGIVLVKNGEIIGELPLPIGGLMSMEPLEVVNESLHILLEKAYVDLKVSKNFDPFISLAFLALPVIPEIKLTDKGLFDVMKNKFVKIDVE